MIEPPTSSPDAPPEIVTPLIVTVFPVEPQMATTAREPLAMHAESTIVAGPWMMVEPAPAPVIVTGLFTTTCSVYVPAATTTVPPEVTVLTPAWTVLSGSPARPVAKSFPVRGVDVAGGSAVRFEVVDRRCSRHADGDVVDVAGEVGVGADIGAEAVKDGGAGVRGDDLAP